MYNLWKLFFRTITMTAIQIAFFLLVFLRLSAKMYAFYQIKQANKLVGSKQNYDLVKLRHVAQQTQNPALQSKIIQIERAEMFAKATLALLLLTVVAWFFI